MGPRRALACFLVVLLGPGLLRGGTGHAENRTERDRRRTPVVQAVEKVAPAVVNISATEVYQGRSPFTVFDDPFFEEFFDRYFEQGPVRESARSNLGSGLVFRPDGYVLTNHHVIARAVKIWVVTSEGRELKASVIGSDPQFDLAVLKVEGGGHLPAAPLGDSDDLMVGESVIAIGNPFGLSNTITTGVVSAVRRSIKAGENTVYHDFIQTDASINPGNSGGPLVNILGEVVGINTAIYRGGEGIGFAIPVNMAKKVVSELIEYGRVHRGWFGLFVQELSPALKQSLGYKGSGGVLVSRIFDGEERPGGVAVGDVIIGLDGREVTDTGRFAEISTGYLPGDGAKAAIFRQGEKRTVTIPCRRLKLEEAHKLTWEILGLALKTQKASGMAITKVRQNSYGQQKGMEKGDLLLEINQVSLESEEDFITAMSGAVYQSRIPVKLQRGNYLYYLTIPTNI